MVAAAAAVVIVVVLVLFIHRLIVGVGCKSNCVLIYCPRNSLSPPLPLPFALLSLLSSNSPFDHCLSPWLNSQLLNYRFVMYSGRRYYVVARGSLAAGEAMGIGSSTEKDSRLHSQDWTVDLSMAWTRRRKRDIKSSRSG